MYLLLYWPWTVFMLLVLKIKVSLQVSQKITLSMQWFINQGCRFNISNTHVLTFDTFAHLHNETTSRNENILKKKKCMCSIRNKLIIKPQTANRN